MGYKLRRWLAEALPDGLSSGERLVALEVADQANEDTRRAYGLNLMDVIVRRTGLSDAKQVGKILTKLAAAGIDYLQILAVERETGNRTIDVGALSRGIKRIAMDFGVPVIIGSQLNRQISTRPDKIPMLSDLRESGSIAQDANVVVLLYRPDYYERESPRAGELDLIVAKNRQGPQCTITIGFQGHYSRALDMAET